MSFPLAQRALAGFAVAATVGFAGWKVIQAVRRCHSNSTAKSTSAESSVSQVNGNISHERKTNAVVNGTVAEPKSPAIVCVTGAAGQIGYSVVFMIAQGRLLGPDQPIELRLLDIPAMIKTLDGVIMELEDGAFPLLTKVIGTADYRTAFQDVDVALLIGARPRGPGMDRRDLLKANSAIFQGQGKALNDYAKRTVKVLVVGNPANTNALITSVNAPNIPGSAFTSMTRLDQNRASAQIAKRLKVRVDQVRNIIIWGNHSNTQYPDVNHAYVLDYPTKGKRTPVRDAIKDDTWLNGEFIITVQSRGAAIIDALKKSSAASAANAALDHIHDWALGTAPGEFVSMAVLSDGSYGTPSGVIFSFPVKCVNGAWQIVQGLKIDPFSAEKLKVTGQELVAEKTDAL